MATIFSDGFETGFTGWTLSGTTARITNDLTVAHAGSRSLLVDNTAGAAQAWLARTITGSTTHVVQFYVRIATATSGTCVIYQASNAQGDMRIRVTAGRVVQACILNTAFSGPTLTLGVWYKVDARFLTGAATATIDWQIDGAVQTQATRAQTSANMTSANLGIVTSVTGKVYFDDILADNSSASYPLGTGSSVSVFPTVSAGTGSAVQTAAHVKPTAGRGTGTGMTWVGLTGDLTVVSVAASGVFDPLDSVPTVYVTPDADRATGTGAANNAGKSSKPSMGSAAGTGTAYNSTVGQRTVSEIASGLGTANNPTTVKVMSVAGGLASGTGASTNSTVALVTGIGLPGLTLQMGMSVASAYPPDRAMSYVVTPTLAVPGYLVPFVDPTWGTNVMRIYNVANSVHTYSKRQAWNPSETKILLGLTSGNRALLDASNYSVINAAVGGDGQWWDDDLLLRANASSGAVFLYNPTTNTNTGTIKSFATYASGSQFNNLTQSSPDDLLRYWLFTGVTSGGQKTVICWDSTLDSSTTLNVTTMPHSGSMSHSGDYIHLNWDTTGTGNEEGIWLLDRTFTRLRQLDIKKYHADFATDTAGYEVLVRQPDGSDDGGVYWRCVDGTQFPLLPTPNAFRHGHVSGRNSNRPGWIYLSTYANDTVPNTGTDQVVAVKLNGTGTGNIVEVFAHAHENTTSDIVGDATAVPNRNGTKVLFHSAWQVLNTSYEYIASAGSL